MRNNLSACYAHEGETGFDKRWLERIKKQKTKQTKQQQTPVLHPVASRGRALATEFIVRHDSQPAMNSFT